MFNVKLKCNCGSSFQIKVSPEEYKDASYAIRAQIDSWMETHRDHLPSSVALPESKLSLDEFAE